MRKTTVGELGHQLPIGVLLPSGQRARNFGFRPWKARDEKEIGEARDKERAMSAGTFTSIVLGHFLNSWGEVDVSGLNPAEQRFTIGRAWAGDVYQAWIQLRRQVIGNEMTMTLTCTLCRHQFGYSVDLGTVEVAVLDDDESLQHPYTLRDGIELAGETRKLLTLSPIRWMAYEHMEESGLNIGALKLQVAAAAITGIEGLTTGLAILPSMLEDLTKWDLESLTTHIDAQQPGPDLAIQVNCPRCSTEIRRSISWVYDSFFSVTGSSPGGTPRKYSENSSSSATAFPVSPAISPKPRQQTARRG